MDCPLHTLHIRTLHILPMWFGTAPINTVMGGGGGLLPDKFYNNIGVPPYHTEISFGIFLVITVHQVVFTKLYHSLAIIYLKSILHN